MERCASWGSRVMSIPRWRETRSALSARSSSSTWPCSPGTGSIGPPDLSAPNAEPSSFPSGLTATLTGSRPPSVRSRYSSATPHRPAGVAVTTSPSGDPRTLAVSLRAASSAASPRTRQDTLCHARGPLGPRGVSSGTLVQFPKPCIGDSSPPGSASTVSHLRRQQRPADPCVPAS
jgi:hypothetical protein